MNILMLVLLTLAAARATRLVTDDLFPFGPLRDWLNRPSSAPGHAPNLQENVRWWLGHGMKCTFCVSVHAGFWAAVLAAYANWIPVNSWSDWPTFAVVWWAIAGGVVLLELVVEALLSLISEEG